MEPRRVKEAEGRFDVVYRRGGATIEPHFCREWDESGGCYGTNPDHGLSLDAAIDEVAAWYTLQAEQWSAGTHPDIARYLPAHKDEAP